MRKTKYINITSNVVPTFTFCSLTTVRSSASPIPTVSKMCVGLREGQSLRGGPHILPSSLFFINHNLCVESGVRTFSAPFCAYASFINETPDPVDKSMDAVHSECSFNGG